MPLSLFYVSTDLDGISPSDAERLLLEPMGAELTSIAGLDPMKSDASIQLGFLPGGENDEALDKMREAADRVESDLPADAGDITEILFGPAPERTLNSLAETLQEEIEGLGGVLQADIGGQRFEFLEALINPTVFQT